MFDDPRNYLWLIPVLPLLASVVTALAGPRWLKQQSHWPCIIAAVCSCFLSFLVLRAVNSGFEDFKRYYMWFEAGNVSVGFTLGADGLTAVMLVTVTFVGSLIAIYSIGYMHHDPGYARYFAEISLFLFSMTGLVLAENFILLYAFWEGVGLCSYLLIGYYYARPSAAAAARKAFLVTRLGDIGLFIGILLLWSVSDHSLDFSRILNNATEIDPGMRIAICLLLFSGAVGKSAQFPLHVWLPDAMEGPSPVSALIHAATMVTAGVYLVARCTPLFGVTPEAQLVVATIGGFTAFLASLIALTQSDLKRVLAYSTISQLGYMFLALGSGTRNEGHFLAGLAVTAAIFHLFTHAFFKALLFLSAGSVMHAMGNVIDMRRFGGLRHVLKKTHWLFLCGAGALSGFPVIFSGFWSKDEILADVLEAGSPGSVGSFAYLFLFCLGMLTAGLTAFYTFRAYFLTFWGEVRIPHEAGEHPHESPPVMLVPMAILAVGAVALGLILGPTGVFNDFLQEHWMVSAFPHLLPFKEHHHNLLLMVASGVLALVGIGLAWWMYVRKPASASELAQALPGIYGLSRNKFYLDEIYNAFIVKPLAGFAQV
ncbi:MAG TPA: NADH-quinone oxidoreductase subunit L, partial [Gemmataceae bacterium]|nr:NADH-quinone oxidoreductase subunit L [Gemmataceae bacterium]